MSNKNYRTAYGVNKSLRYDFAKSEKIENGIITSFRMSSGGEIGVVFVEGFSNCVSMPFINSLDQLNWSNHWAEKIKKVGFDLYLSSNSNGPTKPTDYHFIYPISSDKDLKILKKFLLEYAGDILNYNKLALKANKRGKSLLEKKVFSR